MIKLFDYNVFAGEMSYTIGRAGEERYARYDVLVRRMKTASKHSDTHVPRTIQRMVFKTIQLGL